MRATITITVPLSASAAQLRALASLHRTIEQQRWDSLAATFAKMAREGVELPDELGTMEANLAGQLRVVARERGEDEDQAARLDEAARAPVEP